jgi:hypothetical protein
MAKQRSENSKYESRHGGGWITPAQFLAELMCERFAKKNGQDLPPKFWYKNPWKKEFFKQLSIANKLLERYDPAIVSKALRSSEGKKIFSLGAPWLKKLIDYEEYKFKEVNTSSVEEAVKLPFKKSFVQKKSTFSKLEDIENE